MTDADPQHLAWMDDAACLGSDPDLFFPPLPRGEHSPRAKAAALAICATCTVRTECLTHALTSNEQLGIWGGLTAKDRKHLLRRRWAS